MVSFEVQFCDIIGMEYQNMLIKENCRIVLEANKVTRKCFACLADFMEYYSFN